MSWRERPTALVAWREIRAETRATSFRVTLVISAVAIAAILITANLGDDEPDVRHVVAAGADAARVESLRQLAAAAGIPIEVAAARDDEAARAALEQGEADVAIAGDGM